MKKSSHVSDDDGVMKVVVGTIKAPTVLVKLKAPKTHTHTHTQTIKVPVIVMRCGLSTLSGRQYFRTAERVIKSGLSTRDYSN